MKNINIVRKNHKVILDVLNRICEENPDALKHDSFYYNTEELKQLIARYLSRDIDQYLINVSCYEKRVKQSLSLSFMHNSFVYRLNFIKHNNKVTLDTFDLIVDKSGVEIYINNKQSVCFVYINQPENSWKQKQVLKIDIKEDVFITKDKQELYKLIEDFELPDCIVDKTIHDIKVDKCILNIINQSHQFRVIL